MRESKDHKEDIAYKPFHSLGENRREKTWYGQTVLVTGGLGFIKSTFVLGVLVCLKQQIRDRSVKVV
jgi:hypothetical protein